jgi:hypothetical protein
MSKLCCGFGSTHQVPKNAYKGDVLFLCGFEIEKSARLFILIDLVGTGRKAATVTAVQCK